MQHIRVRCPRCDQKVSVSPKITAVQVSDNQLTVTLNQPSAPHHCGPPANPVGFGPPKKGSR